MNGHGGDKWRMAACERLVSARKSNANSSDHHLTAYSAGNAVEMILVAIGIKQRGLKDVPEDEKGSAWHSLKHLIRAHGVEEPLNQAFKTDGALKVNWLLLKDWDSNARFPTSSVSGKDALETLNAVAHPDHGVFQWLLNRYDQI